ncbi:MAG: hypothetical protein ACKOVA_02180 [Novosphingobium sp.]
MTPPPPSPPPSPPPTPANTLISDLKSSQAFPTQAGTTTTTFDLTKKTALSGQAAIAPATISYNAASNSYTVAVTGFTGQFSPTDRLPDRFSGEAQYRVSTGNGSNYLTLLTTPYMHSTPNKYVGLGYLQQNTITGDRQDTKFSTFAYGLDTPSGAVPRTGKATFAIDVFGLETIANIEPRIFQGLGRFDVDFAAGQFSTTTNLTNTGLITGQGVAGGGIELTGGGNLSASDGSFSGNVVYGSSGQRLSGSLNGRFYGPAADEVGATFAGSGANGSSFNGSFTGQRDSLTFSPVSISFASLIAQQRFVGDATTLIVRRPKPGASTTLQVLDSPSQLGTASSVAQIQYAPGDQISFGTPSSDMPSGTYTPAMIVAGDANFVTYQQDIVGQTTRLALYKTGSANTEVALTYASFGTYQTTATSDPLQTTANRVFFAYGFRTPFDALGNRTGTASYSGVAYGAAADATGAVSDVVGTPQFAVLRDTRAERFARLAGEVGLDRLRPVCAEWVALRIDIERKSRHLARRRITNRRHADQFLRPIGRGSRRPVSSRRSRWRGRRSLDQRRYRFKTAVT